jgi:hypothetical protein
VEAANRYEGGAAALFSKIFYALHFLSIPET